MNEHIQVPLEAIKRAIFALEKFANDTLAGRNAVYELRELLEAVPQTKEQQAAEFGFTELTEKVAEIELAALEEAGRDEYEARFGQCKEEPNHDNQ